MVGRVGLMDSALNGMSKARLNRAKTIERNVSFNDTLKKTMTPGLKGEKKVDEKLKATCDDMEAIFVGKMFKEMRKTVHKTDWFNGGFAEEIFEDMLYDNYSKQVSEKSPIGISDMLYKQLSKNV